MNLNHEYFSRIIYQAGAVQQLGTILQSSKKLGSKVYFISSKTPYQMFGAQVVNQFNLANKEFIFQLIDQSVSFQHANLSAEKAKNCEFVVCLGGGTVIDYARFVAQQTGGRLIIIASSVSNTAAFSQFSYLKKDCMISKFECSHAEKILIDEDFIKNCNKITVQNGIDYILSFWDVVFNLEVYSLLFATKADCSALKIILAKLQDICNSNKSINPLLIMDMQIDLGYFLKDVSQCNFVGFSFALLLKNCQAVKGVSFGKLCHVSSQILQGAYEKFFLLKKLDTYNFLDIEAIACALNRLEISPHQINFANIKQIRTNKQLFLKLNAVKNQVLSFIEKCKTQLQVLPCKPVPAVLDFKKCVSAFSVLPYVYNCSQLTNVLFSSGLIVC